MNGCKTESQERTTVGFKMLRAILGNEGVALRTHSKSGYDSPWNILNGPEKFIIDLEGLHQVLLTFMQERSALYSLRKIHPLLVTGDMSDMPPLVIYYKLVIYCFDFHLKNLSWRKDGA